MRALALLALVAVPAVAQTIYTWEDREGVHFTDDYNLVPPEVRSKSSALKEAAAPAPVARPAVAAAKPAPSPAVALADTRLDEAAWRQRFIDAHRRITTPKDSIAALTSALPPRTECVPQPVAPAVATASGAIVAPGAGGGTVVVPPTPGGTAGAVVVNVAPQVRCGVNVEHDRLKAQIAQEQVQLADAQRDLEQLDRAASLAAVPREWRRGW